MALIVPVVYSALVRENFLGKVKIATLATNLGLLKDTTVGGTVSFPKFKTVSDASEVVRGTASEISELSQDEPTAVIKMVDKIVRVYDIDDMTALGNLINESVSQEAIVMARKLDADLAVEALTSPLKSATAGASAITATELNQALLLFGDEQDADEMAGIVVNSLVAGSFYNMPEFVSMRQDTTLGNGVVVKSVIGYFRGIPVIMTDKGTFDSAKAECVTFIIKKDALAYMEKKGIDVQEEVELKLHCSDIVGTYVYAVKLINDAGVVVVRKTIV